MAMEIIGNVSFIYWNPYSMDRVVEYFTKEVKNWMRKLDIQDGIYTWYEIFNEHTKIYKFKRNGQTSVLILEDTLTTKKCIIQNQKDI